MSTDSTNQMPWWREPTRGQWLSFSAAWLGWILDAFDFTVFMLAMPDIEHEFGVKHLLTTGSLTLTLLLRLAGGYAAGLMADRWGRRLPLMLSLIWFAAFDGAVAIAPSFAAILVLRTLFGFGMGAEWTAGTTLAMENWPQRSRGIASGILQGSWALGYLAAAGAYAFVVPHYGWRALFVLAAVPALLVLPIRFLVPESPSWEKAKKAGATIKMRLKPESIKKAIWASAAMAVGFGAYYGLTGSYPKLLKAELGLGDHLAGLVALFNVGMLAGSVIAGLIAARRGPRAAIAIFAGLSIFAIPFYVGLVPGWMSMGAILGGVFGVGFCGVTPMLLTGLFDDEERARMVGIVYHVGAFFAAFVPMSIAALAQATGSSLQTSIAIVASICELLLVALVLVKRVPIVTVAPEVEAAAE